MYIFIYIPLCLFLLNWPHTHTYIYIYINMYIRRERETLGRERIGGVREWGKGSETLVFHYMCIHVCVSVCLFALTCLLISIFVNIYLRLLRAMCEISDIVWCAVSNFADIAQLFMSHHRALHESPWRFSDFCVHFFFCLLFVYMTSPTFFWKRFCTTNIRVDFFFSFRSVLIFLYRLYSDLHRKSVLWLKLRK